MKIEKLTEEQEQMMEKHVEESTRFVNGGDQSYDMESIKDIIQFLYEGRTVKIVVCKGPMGIFKTLEEEYGYKKKAGETIDPLGLGYDKGWTSAYEFYEKIGVDFSDIKEWQTWKKINKSGIWATVLFENAAFVCVRPAYVKTRDDGNLHCETGPAIGWEGEEYYFLNSIPVPEWLVKTESGQIDPKKALEEKNVDVQREIIRKIGAERMLKKLNAKPIDIFVDSHSSRGNTYKLMEMKIGSIDRKYLYFEHASLPGVWYAQPVPPGIQKALHARAWMLSIGEAEDLEKMKDAEIQALLPKVVS